MLQIITTICVTHVQKNFQFRASTKQLLTKYQIFTKLPQIPHIHINRNFSSIYICNFLDQLLHPYKFYGRDMSGILFFIFASCEPLTVIGLWCMDADLCMISDTILAAARAVFMIYLKTPFIDLSRLIG